MCLYECVYIYVGVERRMQVIRIAGMSMFVYICMFRCVCIGIHMYIWMWCMRMQVVRIAGMSICAHVCVFRCVCIGIHMYICVAYEDAGPQNSRYVYFCICMCV